MCIWCIPAVVYTMPAYELRHLSRCNNDLVHDNACRIDLAYSEPALAHNAAILINKWLECVGRKDEAGGGEKGHQ